MKNPMKKIMEIKQSPEQQKQKTASLARGGLAIKPNSQQKPKKGK